MVLDESRERAAVLIDGVVWIVDRDGRTTRQGHVASEDTRWAPLEPAWRPDGSVAAVGSGAGGEFVLAGGWSLEVTGDVEVDGGFSGGHIFSTGPYEQRTGAHMRLTRGLVTVVAGTEPEAATTLMWPPVVGPHGVLLRRTRSFRTATESLPPWLARADGTLLELPGELGVSPLTALPDGTWLLPGASALWRDDYDEPLHVMNDEGRLSAYRPVATEVRPSCLIESHAPEWAETPGQREAKGDAVWSFEQARFDADANELRLLLTDVALGTSCPEPVRWLALALPHNACGTGTGRLLARGTREDATRIAISV